MTRRTTKRATGDATWFDLATPDFAMAKQFYHQVFGWETVDTGPAFEMADGRMAVLSDPAGATFSIIQSPA